MQELLNDLPNWIDVLSKGLIQTLQMIIPATIFAYILGLPIGVIITITKPGGMKPKLLINSILGWVVNMMRSIPFIILLIYLIPTTKKVMGTSIGSTSMIFPLVIGAAPFVARMVETSLEEVDIKLIEASRAMGATIWQIVTKVMLPEAVPSLIRGLAISMITIIGYSALAGTVGGGGLGDIAIMYGYRRYQTQVMIYTIIILVIIVQIIQSTFDFVAKKIDKRNK